MQSQSRSARLNLRNNLLALSLIFCIWLSVALLFQNCQRFYVGQPDTLDSIAQTWLQPIPIPNLPTKVALIFCNDISGCNACLYAEMLDWQEWLMSDSARPAHCVRLICNTHRPERLRQELAALNITYPVHFDTLQISTKLAVRRFPTVVFCEKGREVCRYVPDLNHREQTKLMQEKFEQFLKME